MSENIFKILKIADKEDVISNLLVHALNKVPSFRSDFLELILYDWKDQYINFNAYTRTLIPETGVPDIVIDIEQKKEKHFLIIIENKLKAKEGTDQTKKYSSQEVINKLKNKFEIDKVNKDYVFLTLFPDQEPASDRFKKITYEDLLKIEYKTNSVIEKLLSDFFKIVQEFYKCKNINSKDNIYKKLSSVLELDGGYLYFKSLIKSLDLDKSLNVEGFFRMNRSGRKIYGARISKPVWHPSKMDLENPKKFEPKKDYNIHFEPQYNVLNGKLNLYLHYEVNPYKPKKWVNKNIPERRYNEYWATREKVQNKLKNKDLVNLKISGRTNQIAKATMDFQNKKAEKMIKSTSELINNVTLEIDNILCEIGMM